jgi:hypothetical protein
MKYPNEYGIPAQRDDSQHTEINPSRLHQKRRVIHESQKNVDEGS